MDTARKRLSLWHYVWFVWLLHTLLPLLANNALCVMGVQKQNCSCEAKNLQEEQNFHCRNHLLSSLMGIIQGTLHSQELSWGSQRAAGFPCHRRFCSLPQGESKTLFPALRITVNSGKISTSAYQTKTLAPTGSLILLAVKGTGKMMKQQRRNPSCTWSWKEEEKVEDLPPKTRTSCHITPSNFLSNKRPSYAKKRESIRIFKQYSSLKNQTLQMAACILRPDEATVQVWLKAEDFCSLRACTQTLVASNPYPWALTLLSTRWTYQN